MIWKMPAISLWQPWASLWLEPNAKVHETRHWPYPRHLHGATIMVHAAKHPISRNDVDDDGLLSALCEARFGANWRKSLPFGAFVGTLRLAGCFEIGDYEPASDVDE